MGACTSKKADNLTGLKTEMLTRQGSKQHMISIRDMLEPSVEAEEQESELRRQLLQEEAELQHSLRRIALPEFERRLSIDELTAFELTEKMKEEAAQAKIQRQELRKFAMTSASNENKWMLFSGSNVFDEDEIDLLTDFMNKVLNLVPSSFWDDQQRMQITEELEKIHVSRESSALSIVSKESRSSLIQNSRENSLDGINIVRKNSADNLVRVNRLKINEEPRRTLVGNIRDFRLPSGFINEKVACDIIELYRQEGKLSTASVHKLLRHAYKKLKTLPNTIHVKINEGGLFQAGVTDQRINIVGDIHGQLPDLLHILDEAGLPSAKNKYIFNGDFVDRGPKGLEVMCILLALFVSSPDQVVAEPTRTYTGPVTT